MASDATQWKDISERILERLEENLKGNGFIGFFDGDPIAIPQSMLPSIVVETTSASTLPAPTGYDKWQENLVIKVVMNKKDDFQGDLTTNETYKKIKKIIQGRASSTGEFHPESIMGALRKNFTLENVLVHQEVNVDIGLAERTAELTTAEGHIAFVVHQLIPIGQRS